MSTAFTIILVILHIAQINRYFVMNNVQSAALIKELCKSKGHSISKLLVDCNIRKSLIYDMEKRDWTPSAEVFEKIADYLNCSVDYLLGRTDVPEVNRQKS